MKLGVVPCFPRASTQMFGKARPAGTLPGKQPRKRKWDKGVGMIEVSGRKELVDYRYEHQGGFIEVLRANPHVSRALHTT
jgi:hypothetical protein